MHVPTPASRRQFLKATMTTTAGLVVPPWASSAPAIVTADSERPKVLQGLQLGDPGDGSLIVWSRSDRPARMIVEWDHDARFTSPRRVVGPHALEATDFTARLDVTGLEPGRETFFRVSFQGLGNDRATSEPLAGRAVLPPVGRDVRFLWGGDTAGQGWGINPGFGGMRIYEAMRRRHPHFFIHSGDTIYADGPIQESTQAEDGRTWTNVVTPEVMKVAETLDEFRGRYRYNLLDEHVRRFNAEVPQIWQWDDHEVTDNWSDSKSLAADERYTEKRVPLLTARGARAFLEYGPMRPFDAREPERVYRRFPYGPLLELFVVDMRSYRGPNSGNLQATLSDDAALLGRAQLEWLKAGLTASRATWKVIAADMPIGLRIGDGTASSGEPWWEAVANGDAGAPRGRELEFAHLLGHLRRNGVRNVVWLTADVHYCAAHYYDPEKAAFHEFDGFWEFVAGPLNAGSFGPNALDATFGPQVVFAKAPPPGRANLSPYSGLQFFGEVHIAASGEMTVDLRDLAGTSVFSRQLTPHAR